MTYSLLFAGLPAGSSESYPMPLGSINIDSIRRFGNNLEVKFQIKYRELEHELCFKLREVISIVTEGPRERIADDVLN